MAEQERLPVVRVVRLGFPRKRIRIETPYGLLTVAIEGHGDVQHVVVTANPADRCEVVGAFGQRELILRRVR
jgi:hypothetical protein